MSVELCAQGTQACGLIHRNTRARELTAPVGSTPCSSHTTCKRRNRQAGGGQLLAAAAGYSSSTLARYSCAPPRTWHRSGFCRSGAGRAGRGTGQGSTGRGSKAGGRAARCQPWRQLRRGSGSGHPGAPSFTPARSSPALSSLQTASTAGGREVKGKGHAIVGATAPPRGNVPARSSLQFLLCAPGCGQSRAFCCLFGLSCGQLTGWWQQQRCCGIGRSPNVIVTCSRACKFVLICIGCSACPACAPWPPAASGASLLHLRICPEVNARHCFSAATQPPPVVVNNHPALK